MHIDLDLVTNPFIVTILLIVKGVEINDTWLEQFASRIKNAFRSFYAFWMRFDQKDQTALQFNSKYAQPQIKSLLVKKKIVSHSCQR